MKRNRNKDSHGNAQIKKMRKKGEDHEEAQLSRLLFHKSTNISEKLKFHENSNLELDQKPAWIDEDDQDQKVQLGSASKAKAVYADKLKQKYETMMGVPNWANLNKQKAEDEDNDDNILQRVGHLGVKRLAGLKSQVLAIKPCQKLNFDTSNEGRNIFCVEFHPKLSVGLVGGSSGAVSLVSVAGAGTTKLHTFKLKKWQIHTANFTPEGTHALISSKAIRNYYCDYDLVKAVPEMVELPHLVKNPSIFELSSDGKYIATSDGYDEIFIISATSRELIRRMKNNSTIVSACFSHNGEQIYCYGAQGEVTMWDLSTFRSCRKFYDQGCVNGSIVTTSPCGRLLATGSAEGIVNIYQTSTLKESTTYNPDPFKTITNLTTKITGLKFNATTEIMAVQSNVLPNAAKLVHIPSYKVFQNFPTQGKEMGNFNCVGFSPNSGYMGMGNNRNCAYLFRLKHYKNY